ncbi:hypothetical protein PIB30_019143 [Stylosanthes scabra]|uniref:Uncharacterized protein n=1 Tax=Stylosanthes scabra TaxID=79078 RepID=A0ABU6X7A1_9FABA|nr:hypothetical protein [Stylosanthes scabra]
MADLRPNIVFLDECGHPFSLSLWMLPEMGYLYQEFAKMLSHHNINGGALILATYYGGCFFRYKIIPCQEDELIPHMRNNCSPIPTQLDPEIFQMVPITEPSILRSYNETNHLCDMVQPSTILSINSENQKPHSVTALDHLNPKLKNLAEEEKDPIESITQENMKAMLEARKLCPMSSNRGLPIYEITSHVSFVKLHLPIRPSHITIVDDQNREFIARIHNKHKNEKKVFWEKVGKSSQMLMTCSWDIS